MRLSSAFVAFVFVLGLLPFASADPGDDPFLWLEEIGGSRAQSWVRTQNAVTIKQLKSDPDYTDTLEGAEDILAARERIAYGTLAAGFVYNFRQDQAHPRGVWRRAPLSDYEDGDPAWDELVDLDRLSRLQNQDWVWKGAHCLAPAFTRCLIKLSRGRDTIVVREFDVPSRTFVKGGFEIAEANTDVAWIDINSIMLATNWGAGSLTRAGQPRFVKVLLRGHAVNEAVTLFEGAWPVDCLFKGRSSRSRSIACLPRAAPCRRSRLS